MPGSRSPFVRIHGLKLVLHLTRLNKVFNYEQKDFRWNENRELECVAPTYLGNWERIYSSRRIALSLPMYEASDKNDEQNGM